MMAFRIHHVVSVVCYIVFITRVAGEEVVQTVIGSDTSLPCYVDISGEIIVSWLHPDGTRLTRNDEVIVSDSRYSVDTAYTGEFNLQIKNVKDKDAGEYSCTVYTNPPQEQLVTLIIQHPPKIESSTADQSAAFGEDVNLRCEASGTPDPVISWYRYDFSGDKKDLGVEGNSYTIRNSTMEDSGGYECEAVNGINPPASTVIQVSIVFPPEIKLPYQHVSQQAGKDTMLQCLITANPHTVMYWQKDGKQLSNSDKYKVEVFDVGEFTKALGARVINLQSTDFGDYTCVAGNEYGTEEATVHLREYDTGTVRVVTTPEDTTAMIGTSTRFNCTVEGITSTDNLIWWHQHPHHGWTKIFVSNPDDPSARVVTTSHYEVVGHYDLLVNDVTFTEAGQYMCELTGHHNYTAHLTVTDSPQCNVNGSLNNSIVVAAGELTVLTCSVDFAGPGLLWEVTWIHGERKLSSINLDSEGQMLRTVYFRATEENTGDYVCTVTASHPGRGYHDQCQTHLEVSKSSVTPAPVCNSSTVGSVSAATYLVIMVVCLAALLIIFCGVIIGITGYYRKRLQKYKSTDIQPYAETTTKLPISYIAFNKDLHYTPQDTRDLPHKPRSASLSALQKRYLEFGDGGFDDRQHTRGLNDTISSQKGVYEEIYSLSLNGLYGLEGIEV